MAVRFRAHLRYGVGSGYAAWLKAQMDVRMGMAFHLRQGSPGQEMSHATTNVVTSGPTGDRREDITINVFWPSDREDLAVDTRDLILATVPWLRPDTAAEQSWMDAHRCRHDLEPVEQCPAPYWRWPL